MIVLAVPTRAQAPQPQRPSAKPAIAVAHETQDNLGRKLPNGDRIVSVLVKLDVVPLASYRGGVRGLAPTSPRVTGARQLDSAAPVSQRYLAYLDQRLASFEQAARAAVPQARTTMRYRTVYGGVAMTLPESQIARLRQVPGVVDVQLDELRKPLTDRSPYFIGADVIWKALAADPALGDGGQGVVVGVIDTGIWPEHPSFADDGSYPPPTDWRGACEQPHDASPPITCTNKLIGAREVLTTYKAQIGLQPDEFDSPRDDEGHGTHTASTAAGNANVPATIFGQPRGIVSGIAPRAYVAMYKALGAAGGFNSDLVAAIDKAVADGVDVINYSIGSTVATNPYQAADSMAFLDAYEAGVFVSVAAGNSGPDANTIGSPANAPWVMSVAASTTDRQFISQLTLRAGADQLTVDGVSITPGVADKPVIDAATLGDKGCSRPLPKEVSGTIVLCERGGVARVTKSANVLAGGGAGMVLYNPTVQDVETDNHWVPTIHVDAPAGTQVISFTAAHSGTTVLGTISTGVATINPAFGDVMAAFSSRGPLPPEQLGISKPDVSAPGVQILAGASPQISAANLYPDGQLFQAIAGTSMAAPHVAGAGALLKALHPDWTPGQIKSALMTTARTAVVKEDGRTPADPYDMGSGRIDLSKAGDPGLTFDVRAADYASGASRLPDLNYPSISIPTMPDRISVQRTARSTLTETVTWAATVEVTRGITVSVEPPSFTVPAGGEQSFTVAIDASGVPDGTYFAYVLLRSGDRMVRMPISFAKRQPPLVLTKRCEPPAIAVGQNTTCIITATNTISDNAVVSVSDVMPPALQVLSDTVTGATLDPVTNVLSYTGTISGVTPVAVNVVTGTNDVISGYLPLASLGIPPSACSTTCDDDAITYIAPPFTFGGKTYDRVTMVTNGYLGIGSDTPVRTVNQRFPDPTVPNNIVAPYWTDLDLDGTSPTDAGKGTWSAAYVTLGPDSPTWFVAEWTNVARYGADFAGTAHTFQVWIEGGGSRIFMVYGPNTATEAALTVGGENAEGTAGTNVYVDTTRSDGPNGTGRPPKEGDILAVTTAPEIYYSHAINYQARGMAAGVYTTTAELNSSSFRGTTVATATVTVEP